VSKQSALPAMAADQLDSLILQLRGHKVMLDADLAAMYGVPTKALNQAVQRNIQRFPEDFMFQLSKQEFTNLISHFAISSSANNQEVTNLKSQFVTSSLHGGVRKLPYAFTEQGVAMLSSVLRSERAVRVNIAIMRAFVSLRGMMRSQDTIKQELSALKRQYKDHDDQIKTIFLMIDEIIAPLPAKKKRKIGYL
jgi:hypothetical protein